VRRYVVETPVERQVELHGERVTIERRHPTTGSGPTAAQFEERVIEVHETDEEPVVQKSARTDEEVVIRREPTERTETVRHTVRHEDVEITPDRTDRKTTP
jgi:stress response protein YsnF